MRRARTSVDLSTKVGSLALPNPIMTASGTSGHGAELAPYMALGSLGAVVVKSLSPEPYPGNPAPRVHGTTAGMLNSVSSVQSVKVKKRARWTSQPCDARLFTNQPTAMQPRSVAR